MPLKIEREDQNAINLTPMIDIVFLLIIFFMVSTKFSERNEVERDLAINVPAVSDATALTAAPNKRLVEVSRDGSIKLDRHAVTLGELKSKLSAAKQQYPKLGVVIRGDGRGALQHSVEVLATCRKAQITDLNITLKQASRITNIK